ncbi:DNA primase [Erythrobacter sp. HL-111]|uniref:DNA primase n=1 Tax=Erythrobacter sp. HL-111 TaxID=1798193 RepID=UPI0006DA091F|nr:DNA primase [Erythrobacter sp. HL-111]KPP93238.1 MAG: DNA primase DnaG [Erythrobacteraceae bacterium HL-111]SDR90606.1 DNA primase [Erythrobacter sp. HL-111]
MTITPQWKDELRARISLSGVIGRTTKLTKAGREWKACCPFHSENTPSFYVNDDKGFYHCFGCEAHGDVISWMIEQRGLSFMDAIRELAAEAGMEVPAPDPVAAKKAEKRATLIDVTSAAQDWFVERLASEEGRAALDYLKARGFTSATLREFGFGYAPDDRQALARVLSRFDEDMLVDSGMRIRTDDGAVYDRFRGRVMLPIRDARGRVIAFGGRILGQREGIAKYLNSPDTPLFDKGRTLYNLDRAAPAARQSGRVIVVEGYMDVVALAQAGFPDAVAPLGTALTETQLEMLWRMVERPILCFDGDAAGQKAAMRAISRALPLLKPARTLGIVHLPAGLDPDDLVRQRGPQAMEALLAEPASLLDTLWEHERAAQPLASPEAKAGLKARLMTHVEAIADPDIRALYRRELLDRFSAFAFPPRPPRTARTGGSGRFPAAAPAPLSPGAREALRGLVNGGARHSFLAAVMAGFVRHPTEIARHVEALSRLARHDPKAAPAIESLIELSETLDSRGQSAISASQGIPAPPVDNRYAFLREGTTPDEAREELAEAVALLVERPALEAALAATIARFESDPEGSFAEQVRLREQLTTVDERLKAFGRRKAAPAAQGRGPAAAAGGSDETALAEDPSAAGEMD